MLSRNLLTACACFNCFPTRWKNPIAVVIHKANKPDYAVPKAYRITTLLPCIGKLYERIMLAQLILQQLLHSTQYRSRAGRSTEQVLTHLLSFVAREQTEGNISMMVFVDVGGALNRVSDQRLQDTLLKARVPYYIVNPVVSFLSKWHMAIKFDGKTAKPKHFMVRIFQSFPLLVFLFYTYIRPLLDTIREEDCFHILYVDDIGLLFSAPKKKDLHSIANRVLASLTQAAPYLKIFFNNPKTEVIVFHRKPNDTTPTYPLQFSNDSFSTTNKCRWLRYHLSHNLK